MATDDIRWYRDAVIYQLHVKSFYDSNADGMGDFKGVIEKLDYIASIGVSAIWLLPFYPSPLRDDGYDIADYFSVHPYYGELDDCRLFIEEAHKRNLRVITELVINHTSDQHPWFQRARHAPPDSPEREYYVWSDTFNRYEGTRIIFLDTETSNWTWDPVAGAYFWHRFFSHQPDLNFDNPVVVEEVIRVMRFWLDMGVDGLRLDAVPYLCEREGTNNENLPETHAILKRLRAWLDANYPDRMLLAEANQWPEDVRAYFGDGDECHMCFHFPLMPRMYMALAREDRYPITDILRQTPEIPPDCQWATFLRNHDELTLEMVTDRERDYLWQFYAADKRARINLGIRRRLAPLLDGDGRKIQLLTALLMAIPGTPILYYGDEIGMGDNVFLGDRNGVRTPMQWSPDRNGGFSRAEPEQLALPMLMDAVYGYASVNVEAQLRRPSSLLNWMRQLLRVRAGHRTFGRGELILLSPGNRKVLAFLRHLDGEYILCVANLAATVQAVQLDLSQYAGRIPVELLDKSLLPPIGALPYLLTLPGYGFLWLLLAEEAEAPKWYTPEGTPLPEFQTFILAPDVETLVLNPMHAKMLGQALATFLPKQRWFGGKGRAIVRVDFVDWTSLGEDLGKTLVSFIDVSFDEGESHRYLLPLTASWETRESDPMVLLQPFVVGRVRRGAKLGVVHDAPAAPRLARGVLSAFADNAVIPTHTGGQLRFSTTTAFVSPPDLETLQIERMSGEQSNTSMRVGGDLMVLKLLRRIQPGIHPELEIGRFLTDVAHYRNTPQTLGAVELVDAEGTIWACAILQEFVRNQGDGWGFTLDYLQRHLRELVLKTGPEDAADSNHPVYRVLAHNLGQRLGELHRAFALPVDDPAFSPEPITADDLAGWKARVAAIGQQAYQYLRAAAADASSPASSQAERLLGEWDTILDLAVPAAQASGLGLRTRHQGDFHLGQTVVVNDDFYILDFEGEPLRPLAERRQKHSPLRDLAGLIRSYDYASHAALALAQGGDAAEVAQAVQQWKDLALAAVLDGYRVGIGDCASIPSDPLAFNRLVRFFILEKALYEICYEAANRPDWLPVPVAGLAAFIHSVEG